MKRRVSRMNARTKAGSLLSSTAQGHWQLGNLGSGLSGWVVCRKAGGGTLKKCVAGKGQKSLQRDTAFRFWSGCLLTDSARSGKKIRRKND
jgi:hypothetical protein